jgi:Arc/MetJ family transcription regulator
LEAAVRITVTLDDELLNDAEKYTGIKERATLIRMGLEALVQREAARRLARLGGSDPNAEVPPRRRSGS